MLVHNGEQYFKAQVGQIDKNEECIISLQVKVTDNNKEIIAHQNKLKPILEGKEKKKRIKHLDGLKCYVDQDAMVTMDFTPSPVYFHLWVTVIFDDVWCWAL